MVYAGVVLLAGSAALVALYRVDVASDHLSLNDALQVGVGVGGGGQGVL